MAKISTYPLDSSLSSSDLLIGTDADNANATKNYSLGSIAAFIQSLAPVDTLQQVLDAGNTATQDISLTGDITILGATNFITAPNALINKLTVINQLRDGLNLAGTNGQALTSTGVATQWKTINLQYVLDVNDTATSDMTLFGLMSVTDLFITGILNDSTNSAGLNGQLLKSTGLGTEWTTVDLDYVLGQGNVATQGIELQSYLKDDVGSDGTLGQVLTATATNTVRWTSLGLQQILNTGDAAYGDINLFGNITLTGTGALDAQGIICNNDIKIVGTITDGNSSIGTPGQVLTATGGNVLWEDAEVAFTSYRGSFCSIVDQTLTAANTPKAIALEVTDAATTNGVSITSDGVNLTRITFAHAGVYNVMFSAQVANSAGTAQTVDFWLRKNGLIFADNVPNTNGKVQLQGGANHLIAAWNYFIDVDAGDFIHLMFSATSTNISLVHEAVSGIHPVTPSVIVTVNKV